MNDEFNKNNLQLQSASNSGAFQFDEDYATIPRVVAESFEAKFPPTILGVIYPSPNNTNAQSSKIAATPPVQIVKVPVPTYSEKAVSWPPFYDAFILLIHDNTVLSDTQKFLFL